MRNLWVVLALVGVALSGCVSDDEILARDGVHGTPNAVVVAVIDSGFNPYHFDMLVEHMPQHLNSDATDDLPLSEDPAMWLPGHPGAETFASYGAVELTTTPFDTTADTNDLHAGDDWSAVQQSSADEVHMTWFPNTKVVGMVNFGSGDGFAGSSHGVGTSTVAVGNIHGACPECLLVFVNGPSEIANRWVESQDWIDAQTNSWGFSALVAVRDRFYAGSDVEAQQAAVERGQAIFFSAGNGLGNTFTAPNPTIFSSQEGPDWIITVGAVHPEGASYTGHGKPADVASVGSGYPSGGYGDNTSTTAEGGFGGTSNATPVTAGMYAKALYELHKLTGQARMQENGTIADGLSGCGEFDGCPAADGRITYTELRDALLEAAEHTPEGHMAGAAGLNLVIPQSENSVELQFMAEGHGTYFGRLNGDDAWQAEIDRILDHVLGHRAAEVNEELDAWSTAVSFCTQILWGDWQQGHYLETPVASNPEWPIRSWFTDECPTQGPAIMMVDRAVTDAHPLY